MHSSHAISRSLRQVGRPVAFLLLVVTIQLPAPVAAQTTERISVSADGKQYGGGISGISISANGRNVAFQTEAQYTPEVVTGGGIVVKDRVTGTFERIDLSSTGAPGNGGSSFPAISANGRYVAFISGASNLVPNDKNNVGDIFVRDRLLKTTERVSISSTGMEGNGGVVNDYPAISGDGRFVVFASTASNLVPNDTNGLPDVFVRDRLKETTTCLSVSSTGKTGNNFSGTIGVAISADGRYAAFASSASNLLSGDTNGNSDVFVRNLQLGTIVRASVKSNGKESTGGYYPAISADGRYVAFLANGDDLVPNDNNGATDVFVWDRNTNTTERVSVSSSGTQGNNSCTFAPSISGDGRFVSFTSAATNLVSGDTNNQLDVFVHDRQSQTTTRLSVSATGVQANRESRYSRISGDGASVVFDCQATNFVTGLVSNVDETWVRGPLISSAYAEISGTITLTGWLPDAAPQLITVTLRPTDGSGDFDFPMLVTPEGQFDMWLLPKKNYQLHFKGDKYLAANVMVDATQGDVSGVQVTLLPGDATNDNIVDFDDLTALAIAYNTAKGDALYDDRADFNGDHQVEFEDLTLLAINYNLSGDP